MSIELMRVAIVKAYPGEKWKNRVKKMPDAQVIAVYNRMLNNNQLKI